MVEEILKNLYKIQIPLAGNPLKAMNSYALKGVERTLIVDVGWNQNACREATLKALGRIGVDLQKTDFFVTHFHADHIGLLPKLVQGSTKIYFNQIESDWMKREEDRWKEIIDYARLIGFPENELQPGLKNHPGYKYRPRGNLSFTIIKEHDQLRVGDYQLECLETRGHTRGHLCLYEAGKRFLFSGDHILGKITPNIQLWSDDWNPLKLYLDSLDKVLALDVKLVFPGHGKVFDNCANRIQELKWHHQKRLQEIVTILGGNSQNPYQIASNMTWDISHNYGRWNSFPVQQKWFGTGEAMAHLKYLEERNIIRREKRGGIYRFERIKT